MSAPKSSSLRHLSRHMRAAQVCVAGTILMFGASFTSCALLLMKAKHH